MINIGSIVLELQKEIISSNCDIVNVLRKAHLIASKLKLTDFDQWIQYELDGYPDQQESCPEYRNIRGSLKAFNPRLGWIPALINDNELEKEKYDAINMPPTVNNYYGNTSVINSPSDNVKIVSGSENSVLFSYDKVRDVVDAIEKSINETNLAKDDMEIAIELLADIKLKIEEEKKPHILKSALVGLEDFLINTGANVAAGLIQTKMHGLF